MIPPINLAIADDKQRLNRTVQVVNGLLNGRNNAIGTFTLAVSTTTTQVTDMRVGVDSVITFMPTTSRAASSLTAVYVSSRLQNSFIVTHDSQTYTDRVYAYKIGGG